MSKPTYDELVTTIVEYVLSDEQEYQNWRMWLEDDTDLLEEDEDVYHLSQEREEGLLEMTLGMHIYPSAVQLRKEHDAKSKETT